MDKKHLIMGICLIIFVAILFIIFNLPKTDNNDDPIDTPTELNAYFTDILIRLEKGETYEAILEVENPKNENITIEYDSSDESIATVNDNGTIKALDYGIATITAIVNGEAMSSLEINVLEEEIAMVEPSISVERVDIIETEIKLTSNQKYQLTTNIYPSNATDKTLMYETNDSRIAEVTDAGLVIGKVAGTTIINVYSNNDKTDTVEVTVNAPTVSLEDIQIMPNEVVLIPKETYQLRATLIPSNAINSNISWTSSDSSIASVNSRGVVTANKVGTATITASSNGITSEALITVQKQNMSTIVTSVSLNKKSIELDIGQTEKITATISPSNATNKGLIWSTGNSSVATVTSSGEIKGVSKGTTIITAKSINNVSATINVTVTEKVSNDMPASAITLPTEILLNVESISLEKKATKQLRATILPLKATNQSVTWVSSDESVVSVSTTGLITAKKIGDATVSAITSNGKVAKAKVVVTAKPITAATQASSYGNGSLSESTIAMINEHLQDYLEEAAYKARKEGKSERKAKVVAAAYFLIFNPYYKVPYGYGRLSKYNYQGWNPNWSNTVGVECSGFVIWSLIQAGLPLGTNAQYYPARITQSDANTYWTVDYVLSISGLEVGDILNKRYPRDENNNKTGNGHWAVIVDMNKKDCTLTVAHATSVKEGLHLSTYKCGTTIHYNRAFNTDKY